MVGTLFWTYVFLREDALGDLHAADAEEGRTSVHRAVGALLPAKANQFGIDLLEHPAREDRGGLLGEPLVVIEETVLKGADDLVPREASILAAVAVDHHLSGILSENPEDLIHLILRLHRIAKVIGAKIRAVECRVLEIPFPEGLGDLERLGWRDAGPAVFPVGGGDIRPRNRIRRKRTIIREDLLELTHLLDVGFHFWEIEIRRLIEGFTEDLAGDLSAEFVKNCVNGWSWHSACNFLSENFRWWSLRSGNPSGRFRNETVGLFFRAVIQKGSRSLERIRSPPSHVSQLMQSA